MISLTSRARRHIRPKGQGVRSRRAPFFIMEPIDVYTEARQAFIGGDKDKALRLLADALGTTQNSAIRNGLDKLMEPECLAHEALLQLIGYEQYAKS